MRSICQFFKESNFTTSPDGRKTKYIVCNKMIKKSNEIEGLSGAVIFKTPVREQPFRPNGCPYELEAQKECPGFEPAI